MRGETWAACGRSASSLFQSTPLMRGETSITQLKIPTDTFQSTPLMRGETRPAQRHAHSVCVFQSTPLMRGETYSDKTATDQPISFQSTPLMRGETVFIALQTGFLLISIHSPHARGDGALALFFSRWCNFNPLPSCEGRPEVDKMTEALNKFQSTPLMRGETSPLADLYATL